MHKSNLLDNLPGGLPEEFIETICSGGRFRIERIVSRGHSSPEGFWYDQAEDEWVVLLSGRARLSFEAGESVELSPGDYLDIPAHCRHRVDTVHYVPPPPPIITK